MTAYCYISSSKYSAVSQWQPATAYNIGDIIRATDASLYSTGACYICLVAGTSDSTIEPTWPYYSGSQFLTGTALFTCAGGLAALNGVPAQCEIWLPSTYCFAGQIIKNVSGGADTYFICNVNGTGQAVEPSWDKTPGGQTADGETSWTSLGPISNYTTPWGAPYQTLAGADSFSYANNTVFYISQDQAEAGTIYLVRGTRTAPVLYLCVDDSNAPPTALATTATFTSGGSMRIGQEIHDDLYLCSYSYGLNFTCTYGDPEAMDICGLSLSFDECSFGITPVAAPGYACHIAFGRLPSTTEIDAMLSFLNCDFVFSDAAQYMEFYNGGPISFVGGSVAATGIAPSTLYTLGDTSLVSVADCDLSGITGTLVDVSKARATTGLEITNCKLASGVAYSSGSINAPGTLSYKVFNSDSTATNYNFYTQTYMGISQAETTVVRNGGASNGTTPLSWKLISTANSSYGIPFQSEDIVLWNTVVGGPIIAYIEIAASAALNTNDIWMQMDYLGNGSYPLGSVMSTKGTPLSNIAVTASTASWTGSPSNKQMLELTIDPIMVGIIRARIFLAKPSTIVYIDPYITLTAGAPNRVQYMLPGGGSINETSSSEFSYTFVG